MVVLITVFFEVIECVFSHVDVGVHVSPNHIFKPHWFRFENFLVPHHSSIVYDDAGPATLFKKGSEVGRLGLSNVNNGCLRFDLRIQCFSLFSNLSQLFRVASCKLDIIAITGEFESVNSSDSVT